jgi:hypothetical protein
VDENLRHAQVGKIDRYFKNFKILLKFTKIIWDCKKYKLGIYFYSITINVFHKTGKIIKN